LTQEDALSIFRKLNDRRKVALALIISGLIVLPLGVAAYDALVVDVPSMPAVGEKVVGACDPDGATTSFTYGNTSSNGIKVDSITVSDIAAACTKLTVAFMDGSTSVATYSGSVGSGTATLNTTVWTYEFTSVRVALFP
jgi:hypothetical protein